MGVFDSVFASSVRQRVLAELSERPRQRRDLLDDVDASKSAVYDALNELRDRDLLREGRARRWESTGLGDLVADYVAARERTGDVLSTHADFWASHDPTALPEPFRDSLGALQGSTRLTAPETEPLRVVSEVVDVIERADRIDLIAPIYHDRYAAALERAATDSDRDRTGSARGDCAEVRLLLAVDVHREIDEREDAEWEPENPAVRLANPSFSLLVTDDTVLLALPRDGGTYDPSEKLYADSDRARDWGRRLFEHHWRDATPLDALQRMDGATSRQQ